MQDTSTRAASSAEAFAPELSQAVASGISVPLSALRASMESLAHALDVDDPRASVLTGALDEVVRMGRNVQALLDLTHPPCLRPLDCTRDEIALGAVQSLGKERAARVLLAVENGDARLFVDGPLLSRSLSHLIETGLSETSHPVLVSARATADGHLFTVLYVEPSKPASERSSTSESVDAPTSLGLALAQREIRRMHGQLTRLCTPSRQIVWIATLPRHSAHEGSA